MTNKKALHPLVQDEERITLVFPPVFAAASRQQPQQVHCLS